MAELLRFFGCFDAGAALAPSPDARFAPSGSASAKRRGHKRPRPLPRHLRIPPLPLVASGRPEKPPPHAMSNIGWTFNGTREFGVHVFSRIWGYCPCIQTFSIIICKTYLCYFSFALLAMIFTSNFLGRIWCLHYSTYHPAVSPLLCVFSRPSRPHRPARHPWYQKHRSRGRWSCPQN